MYLREFTLKNITDIAVIFRKRLNPKLWKNDTMHPLVRYKLLKIAKDFIEFIDIDNIGLKDITISGSNAAFTYTNDSDIDLHLVVDIPLENKEQLSQLFDAKKNQYNFDHDIKIKGIDVELYVQDSTQPHHSAGIYSVLDNRWLETPKAVKVDINDTEVSLKVKNYLDRINMALISNNIDDAKKVRKELGSLRKTGLEREGEFSIENIAFKILRNKGFIDKLRDHEYALKDKNLSLEGIVDDKMQKYNSVRVNLQRV